MPNFTPLGSTLVQENDASYRLLVVVPDNWMHSFIEISTCDILVIAQVVENTTNIIAYIARCADIGQYIKEHAETTQNVNIVTDLNPERQLNDSSTTIIIEITSEQYAIFLNKDTAIAIYSCGGICAVLGTYAALSDEIYG